MNEIQYKASAAFMLRLIFGQCTRIRSSALLVLNTKGIERFLRYSLLSKYFVFKNSETFNVQKNSSIFSRCIIASPIFFGVIINDPIWRIGNTLNKKVHMFSSRYLSTVNRTNKTCIKNPDFEILAKESNTFISKLKGLNFSLWTIYQKDPKSSILFSSTTINDIQDILNMYNLLISKLMLFYKKSVNLEKIIHNNQPVIINRLQNLLIESFSLVIYSIDTISKFNCSKTPGTDGICFKTSKNFEDQYILDNMSKKKRNAVKHLSTINIETQRYKIVTSKLKKIFIKQAIMFNQSLKIKMIPKCLIKTFHKNYIAGTIKRIWISKPYKIGSRPLGILTIREKIIQKIILLSCTPIIEFTCDPLSFGFRENRSANECVAYGFKQLYTNLTINRKQTRVRRITQDVFYKPNNINSTKIRQRTILLSKSFPINKRKYNYIYWEYTEKKGNFKPKVNSYKKIINVDIEKCFDNLSHKSILKFYPITKKYKYLVKAWLVNKIYGLKSETDKRNTYFFFNKGVPQGSIIGPSCCNVALDGLEKHLLSVFPGNTRFEGNQQILNNALKIHKKNKIIDLNDRTACPSVSLETIRFADAILIIAKMSNDQILKVISALKFFLGERGLKLKIPLNNKIFFTFKPGTKFSYLGFDIWFPNYKNKIFTTGKYTKLRLTPDNIGNNRFIDYSRSSIFISIKKTALLKQKNSIKHILQRSAINRDVDKTIELLNEQIRSFANYFNISKQCRIVLKTLSSYIFKRLKKLLYIKFKSKSKTGHYISNTFVRNSTIQSNKSILLKYENIRPYGVRDLTFPAKSNEYLK